MKMKIKTSRLTGAALDWAVATCEGSVTDLAFDGITWGFKLDGQLKVLAKGWAQSMMYLPSTDWSLGGPILTESRITRTIDHSGLWVAYWTEGYGEEDFHKKWMQCDRSELVAGLRCYVASKLGDEVDVPDELM